MRLRIFGVLVVIIFANLFCGQVFGEENYFAVLLNDQKCGYAVQSRQVIGDTVVTTEKMELTINRFNVPITVETIEKCRETLNGEPLGFENIRNMSMGSTKIKGTVKPNGMVEVTTSSGGSTYENTIRYPEGAVMMEGLRQIQLDKGLEPGIQYSVKVFSPQLTSAVDTRVKVGEEQVVNLAGTEKRLHKVTTTMQVPTAGEIVTTSFVDEDFVMHKSTIPFMNMKLELVECPKEAATGDINPVEIAVQSFVSAPSDLTNLQDAKKATYVLQPTDPKQRLSITQTDSQKVTRKENGEVKVIIKKRSLPEGVKISSDVGDDAKEYLSPGRYVQSDASKIIELSRKAVGDTKDAGVAAEKIESFAADYIDRGSLSVGYATASETAETRTGDCSEFAVLTAALCRAAGIPARVAVGIAYVDEFAGTENSFGGHAWTQVYIGGKWYDLDAAFKSAGLGGFDCGHIVLATGGGAPEDFLSLINTIGKIKMNSAELEF
jgi:hypothetical protein